MGLVRLVRASAPEFACDSERDLIRNPHCRGRSQAQKPGQHMDRPPRLTDAQKAEARLR
jgi:hypothetical protein